MYEIWLVMNILWELALGIWPLLAGAGVLWLAVVMAAATRPNPQWGPALVPALGVAVAAGVLAFVAVPGLTRSSLVELRYWVDWFNLAGVAAAAGGIALAFAWPLAAMRGAPGAR